MSAAPLAFGDGMPRQAVMFRVSELWHGSRESAQPFTFDQARRRADELSSFTRRPYTVFLDNGTPRGQVMYTSIAGYWSDVRQFVEELATGRGTSLFKTLHAWVTYWMLHSQNRPQAAEVPAAVERFMSNRYLETAARYLPNLDGRQVLSEMARTAGRCSLELPAAETRTYHQPLSRWLLGKDTGKDAVTYYYEAPQVVALFARLTCSEQGSYQMVRTAGVEPACPEGRWNLKANQPPIPEPTQSVTAKTATPATTPKGKDTGKDSYAEITLSFEAIQDIIRQLREQHHQLENGFSDLQRAITLYAPERFHSVATRQQILEAAAYLVREGFAPEAR